MKTICFGVSLFCWLVPVGLTQEAPVRSQISSQAIDPHSVRIVHLHPGYATSVRLPEGVSSVMIGNPEEFRAEHSESEPKLVFIKPLTSRPAESNALITTRSGQEICLQLVSEGKAGADDDVDFVVEYQPIHSVLIEPSETSAFLVAETEPIHLRAPSQPSNPDNGPSEVERQLAKQKQIASPPWQGKEFRTAIGDASEQDGRLTVSFSVLNDSSRWIELLVPQVELMGKSSKGKPIKAEPIAVSEYQLTARRLAPGARADGIVVFERPSFKESAEGLVLQLAEADRVDQPVRLPLPFIAAAQGGTQ